MLPHKSLVLTKRIDALDKIPKFEKLVFIALQYFLEYFKFKFVTCCPAKSQVWNSSAGSGAHSLMRNPSVEIFLFFLFLKPFSRKHLSKLPKKKGRLTFRKKFGPSQQKSENSYLVFPVASSPRTSNLILFQLATVSSNWDK
jgi:hypothetical protein